MMIAINLDPGLKPKKVENNIIEIWGGGGK
jgi:hypothetical protein